MIRGSGWLTDPSMPASRIIGSSHSFRLDPKLNLKTHLSCADGYTRAGADGRRCARRGERSLGIDPCTDGCSFAPVRSSGRAALSRTSQSTCRWQWLTAPGHWPAQSVASAGSLTPLVLHRIRAPFSLFLLSRSRSWTRFANSHLTKICFFGSALEPILNMSWVKLNTI